MAQQGWYNDPGGQPGMYRYWDGTGWSEALSPTPAAPPPTFAYSQPLGGYGATSGSQQNPYAGMTSASTTQQNPYDQFNAMPKTKKSPGPWIILGVVVVVLGLIIYFAVTRMVGTTPDPDQTTNAGGNSTTSICPKMATSNERAEHPSDNRVYGGKISYPQLGSPWSGVDETDYRIPFGRDVAEQMITVHPNYDGPGTSWVASIMIGELYAGDGFYSPQQGSEIVNKCIFGVFYGDAELQTETLRSEAYTLDGYEGWITVTNLSFSIPNLATTSEVVTIIIIKTSDMSSSIFYSSIPNDTVDVAPNVDNDVDATIAGLRVET